MDGGSRHRCRSDPPLHRSGGGDSGGNGGKNGNGGEDCDAVLLAVAVFDKEDHVLGAAEVTVIGPYPIVPGVTPEHTGTTDFFGVAKIELPKPGEYDIAVSREGYEDASLWDVTTRWSPAHPRLFAGETWFG